MVSSIVYSWRARRLTATVFGAHGMAPGRTGEADAWVTGVP